MAVLVTMNARFHLLIFMSFFLLVDFAQPQFIYYECYPDTEWKCHKDSLQSTWPETTTRILLFTRKNQKEPEHLHVCNGTLPKYTHFNSDNELFVIIPGFMFGTCEMELIPEIKDELLEKGDFNVILVDNVREYGNDFIKAMRNAERAANITAIVLRNIQAMTGIESENIHLVGHSLGAHAAGFIGAQFKVGSITALDPAGVTFTKDTPIDKRLDPSDADVVAAIHTNGGSGLPYLGAHYPLGDADIYVNGGSIQPNCAKTAWDAVKNFNLMFGVGVYSLPTMCAHVHALEYYKESINNYHGKFIAWSCSSYKKFKTGNCTGEGVPSVIMGIEFQDSFTEEQRAEPFPRKYFIDTKDKWPFV